MTKLLFDPQIIPVESLAGESAIHPSQLRAEWLRTRFENPPQWQPENINEHLLRQRAGPVTPAAVLMPIVLRDNGPTLLFTQRTEHLTDHGGQVSFPGGN